MKNFLKYKYNSISSFYLDYFNYLVKNVRMLNIQDLEKIESLIEKKINLKKNIFVCGNGGSAAIANHYVCDFSKLLRENTKLDPKFYSLSSNVEMISAIGNDLSYEEVFSYQASCYAKRGDLIVIISSSGNSKNVINLARFCKTKKIETICISGFSGGALAKSCQNKIIIHANNYGVTEDITHMLMHIIVQYLKQKYIPKNKIKFSRF